ncbi:ACT domain-containing protein ACR6 [Camellia lanceoleosa]|uniref:ACT domain-containing protein ACR6 n=1 Tax=Camellia lanceoleosa TaxID=1840588 RepID=A0ACC0G472_9ERIC|nr:ACT domain-containing protein ACR6 [Camellia lanceoleosa]
MGGHDDSGSSEKKSIGVANDVPTFNAKNMQNNMKAIYYWSMRYGQVWAIKTGMISTRGDFISVSKSLWFELLGLRFHMFYGFQVDSVNKHGILLEVVQVLTDLNLIIRKAYLI